MIDIKELLQTAAENTDCQYRDDYSGRGMFGSKCVAIVGDADNLVEAFKQVVLELTDRLFTDAIDAVGDEEHDDAYRTREEVGTHLETLLTRREDGMGLQYVWYWPKIN